MRQADRPILHARLRLDDHRVERTLGRFSRQCRRVLGRRHACVLERLSELTLYLWIIAEQENTEDRRRERHGGITQEEGRIIAQSQFDVNEEIWQKFPMRNIFHATSLYRYRFGCSSRWAASRIR